MTDIIMAGFGGQGILTAGKIMIDVAAKQGKEICWTSSYGASMRGGTASCTIVIDDEEIGSPYPAELDILMAMNEPSYLKFVDQVKDGGTIIANTSLMGEMDWPKNVNVYTIDATDLANDSGNGRAANLVMLGALMENTDIMDADEFGKGLDAYFDHKGRNNPGNAACYKLGREKAEKK